MNVNLITAEALTVLGSGRQVEPFSGRYAGFGLNEAYHVTAGVRAAREFRGERPNGRKIGFTNRIMWAEHNVRAPIWSYTYDHTVHELTQVGAPFSLDGMPEPRIEPEIVFGLASAPTSGMSERTILGCIEWVALGFEIVQSIFPGWKFAPADTVAGFGLHGALLIGPRHPVAPRLADWERELPAFEIDLFRDGTFADHGRAANVLDGPVSALRHLVELLAGDPINPALAAGEIITTGTLTRALPVAPGEVWTTSVEGIPLEAPQIRFT